MKKLIFDVNKKNKYSPNVQKNLLNLYNKSKGFFVIKNKDIELPSKISYGKYLNDKESKYFEITYDDNEKNDYKYFPFSIEFLDYETKQLNNNCYIKNFHKTKDLSGTTIINTIILFLKKICVIEAVLHDGAFITCKGGNEARLSEISLLEKNRTFYEKFGFKKKDGKEVAQIYGTYENMIKHMKEMEKIIKKIKTSEIINYLRSVAKLIFEAINNLDLNNLEIISKKIIDNKEILGKYNLNDAVNAIQKYYTIIEILSQSQKKYFRDFIAELAINNCDSYAYVSTNLFFNDISRMVYKKKELEFKYKKIFNIYFDVLFFIPYVLEVQKYTQI